MADAEARRDVWSEEEFSDCCEAKMQNEKPWCDDYQTVIAFGGALVQAGFDAKELLAALEKPWNWTTEYKAWKEGGQEALEAVLEAA